MKKISKSFIMILILFMLTPLFSNIVYAGTFEFDPRGETKNPFYPRGYMIDAGEGKTYWLSSPFDNSSEVTVYKGIINGLDYVNAEKAGTLYALTDRNPTPGKQYLSGYINGTPISDFASYIGVPSRADIATTGKSTGWKIPIDIKLEPGSRYEFAFLRGLKANNGITLVFSEDGKGYIQNPQTAAEWDKYNRDKYDEYEFIVSYEKNTDPETKENTYFNFYMVPMRFTVQTYADISEWEDGSETARQFLLSVNEADYEEGKYKKTNVDLLKVFLEETDESVNDKTIEKLQPQADSEIKEKLTELEIILNKAKSDKPEPADISKLKKKIEEAEALYAKASVNTGVNVGQYGDFEVFNLGAEIEVAKSIGRFEPQYVINDQTESLEAAILEVKKSKVLEDLLYFYDKATGIYVIAPHDSLAPDAKLFVRRFGEESEEYNSIADCLSEDETEAVYYMIQFYEDEYMIQPNSQVEVQIPMENTIDYESSNIYLVDDNDRLKKIDSVKIGDTQVFKTDVLGGIVMAGADASNTPVSDEEQPAVKTEQMDNLIRQTEDEDKDNTENKLEAEKLKKEEFKDPIEKLLNRKEAAAAFTAEVKRDTNPIYLLYIAAILAAVAIIIGIRRFRER